MPAVAPSSTRAGGAAALSILTEPSEFGGSLADLAAARGAVAIPLLRKDFIVDEVQLLEARVSGASAVLLIARALLPDASSRWRAGARSWSRRAARVRDEPELERALGVPEGVIGVNNRNLETLRLDDTVSERLLRLIPGTRIAVYESGVRDVDGVRRAAALGAGRCSSGRRCRSPMRLRRRCARSSACHGARVAEVKFCGLTRPADAAFGSALGAAFVGAVFAGGPAGSRRRRPARCSRRRRAPARRGVSGSSGRRAWRRFWRSPGRPARMSCNCTAPRTPATVSELRRNFGGEVWRVLRVSDATRELDLPVAAEDVDAVVVDAFAEDQLGGTGCRSTGIRWPRRSSARDAHPGWCWPAGCGRRMSGGRSELVAPDVVDVSSGVESAPGSRTRH